MGIKIATSGRLEGHAYANVDLERLQEFKSTEYQKHVGYDMGAKDPEMGSGQVNFDNIDCSGDVRTILVYSTHGVLANYPDGSYVQNDYCRECLFKHTQVLTPDDVKTTSLVDGLVRVAFHKPNGRGGDATGHTAIFINGHSVESYGGHGPGERLWDHQWFLDHWDDIYVIGSAVTPWSY